MSSGNPVADSTAGSNLYYTPFKHDIIVLWDGTRWVPVVFAETQVTGGALSGLTSSRPYDVFAYLSSGALALEILVWTSVTTRATAVTYQDGRLCKSGDKTRLLMGSFYASSTTQTKHQMDLRHVDNIYWQEKTAIGVDLAGNWTYGTNTWRQVNGGTGGYKVEVMCSQPKSITCRSLLYVIGSVGAGASAGIGIDSTSAVHADADWCENQSPAPSVAWVETQLGAGLRTIYPLEIARAGTLNIYGESASAVQGGLKGSVMM